MSSTIKISELSELTSGSLTDTSIVPIVESGGTYKAKLSSILAYMDDTLASDSQLSNQVTSLDNRIQAVENNLDSLIDVGVPAGTVSSSAQIDYTQIQNKVLIGGGTGIQITTTGANQFTASLLESYVSLSDYETDSGSFNFRISQSKAQVDSFTSSVAKLNENNNYTEYNLFENYTEFQQPIFLTSILPIGGFPTPQSSIELDDFGNLRLVSELQFAIISNVTTVTGSVVVKDDLTINGMLSAPQYPDSETSSLSPRSGSIIWNTVRNKLQVFTGLGWEDIH